MRWVFQNPALVTHVPDVAVTAINLLCRCRNRNVMFFGVSNGVVSGLNIPLTPRSNDFKLGGKCPVCEFKSDLIVTLTGATMGYRVRAFFEGDFDLTLRQKGSGDCGTEQVFAFVYRA